MQIINNEEPKRKRRRKPIHRVEWLMALIPALLLSCSGENRPDIGSKENPTDCCGTYYDPVSGEILFRITKDSSGYKAQEVHYDPSRPRRMEEIAVMHPFTKKSGICGDYLEYMEEAVIGGEDWAENYEWGLSHREFLLIRMKPGYQSTEHIFKTGYAMITGSQCFRSSVYRLNVERLEEGRGCE